MNRLKYCHYAAIGVSALLLTGVFTAKPLLAQIKAALVQNIDEPGRNPYQESQFTVCSGPQNCNFQFATIPAGKRLVLTHLNGWVDVRGATLPNSSVSSSFGGNSFASVFFPGTRGTVGGGSTRIIYNTDVLAYFGPGETPSGFYGLFSTTDTFASSGVLTLSGYFITLP